MDDRAAMDDGDVNDPTADISRIEIPQRSSLLPC